MSETHEQHMLIPGSHLIRDVSPECACVCVCLRAGIYTSVGTTICLHRYSVGTCFRVVCTCMYMADVMPTI